MTAHHLTGLRPTPLGSYLAGLGVLRLVGEQADPAARASWQGGHLALDAALGRAALVDFFLDEYRPTPIVSPWNGGSGFYPGDSKAIGQLELIEASAAPRLGPLQTTVEAGRAVLERMRDDGWAVDSDKERKKAKARIVTLCRATFPDAAVTWLDAAVVLTGDDVVFPTLLGTGGNFGRLELSGTFHGLLCEVLTLRQGRGAPDRGRSLAWLEEALYETGTPKMVAQSPGQFEPAAVGGASSGPLGAAASVVNPWSFVLLMEGALLFASGAARRLGAVTAGKLAMPFTVDASPVGYSSRSEEEGSKGEVWAPLWERPASLPEVGRLLGEGRASWRDGQASDGLDFVRAAHSLGVDRGISSFVRHALVVRLGQSTLAVPVGVTKVQARPEVALLGTFDPWVDRVRRADAPPATVRAALGALDEAVFTAAEHEGPRPLQEVLVHLAALEEAVARAPALREKAGLVPLASLQAAHWAPRLDDETAEFDLAASLAAGSDRDGDRLRTMLRSMRWHPRPGERQRGRLRFTDRGARVEGLQRRPLLDVLGDVLVLRVRDRLEQAGAQESEERQGIAVHYERLRTASPRSLAALLSGRLDLERLGRLLSALLLLDWRGARARGSDDPAAVDELHAASPAFALLAPFSSRGELRSITGDGEPRAALLGIQPDWPALLRAGRTDEVLKAAHLRLRIAGFAPGLPAEPASALCLDSGGHQRLAAALLVPLRRSPLERLLTRVAPGGPAE